MIFPDLILRKKVNIIIVILTLLVVALLAAWAISAKAVTGADTGLRIMSMPVKCALDPGDPPPGTCIGTCPVCGSIKGTCAGLYEVRAVKIKGGNVNPLYQGAALCLSNPKPPLSGNFRAGGFCLGKIIGFGPHKLLNFGCNR